MLVLDLGHGRSQDCREEFLWVQVHVVVSLGMTQVQEKSNKQFSQLRTRHGLTEHIMNGLGLRERNLDVICNKFKDLIGSHILESRRPYLVGKNP